MKEINSSEVVFNRYQFLYLFCFVIGILLVLLDLYVFGEFELFFILGVLMTVLYFVVIVIEPFCFAFDKERLLIIHTCGLKETIYYKDIKWIRKGFAIYRSGCPAYKYFEIYYPHQEKFLLKSEVCKTKKVERLLKYYTNLEIE